MLMPTRRLVATLVLAALASVAPAQVITVPNIAEDDTASGLNTPIRSAGRSYQAYYNQVNFTSITQPTLITGMALRLALGTNSGVAAGGTWPSQPLSFNNYDVQLSRGSAAVQADGEFVDSAVPFAGNQGGTVTTVRSGSMTIPTGSFSHVGDANPNPFGFLTTFTTPYLYTPGEELVLTIHHDGYLPGTELQPFFASNGYAPNFNEAVSSTAGYGATTPSGFSDPIFVQFNLSPVPEPSSMLLAGVPFLGATLARYRRRTVGV